MTEDRSTPREGEAQPRQRRAPKADRLQSRGRDQLRRLRGVLHANLEVHSTASGVIPGDTADLEWPVGNAADAGDEHDESRHEVRDTDDPLPEHMLYRDDGCHVAPACLTCPLPACIYDHGLRASRRLSRDDEIRALAAGGWRTARLARHFTLSTGQIQRIVGRRRGVSGAQT